MRVLHRAGTRRLVAQHTATPTCAHTAARACPLMPHILRLPAPPYLTGLYYPRAVFLPRGTRTHTLQRPRPPPSHSTALPHHSTRGGTRTRVVQSLQHTRRIRFCRAPARQRLRRAAWSAAAHEPATTARAVADTESGWRRASHCLIPNSPFTPPCYLPCLASLLPLPLCSLSHASIPFFWGHSTSPSWGPAVWNPASETLQPFSKRRRTAP